MQMKKITIAILVLGTLVFGGTVLFYLGVQNGNRAGHEEMSNWYESNFYTNCKSARTWQITNWNIDCGDGYTYERIEPESQEEKQKREADAKAQWEESKAKWLAENPPVKTLFPEGKEYDTAYVIQYLKENKIAGHCALVWRIDVVCADGARIMFPRSRE